MKKFFSIFVITMLLINGLMAQHNLAKGGKQLNVGVGLSDWGIPIYIGLDFGVQPNLSLGAEVSYRSYSDNWEKNSYRHSILGFSANGNYHFNEILNMPKQWDFYAGLNLGFYAWVSPNEYHGTHNSGVGLGGQIGARYFISNNFGLNLELGGGTVFSNGKFGITYKF